MLSRLAEIAKSERTSETCKLRIHGPKTEVTTYEDLFSYRNTTGA
jgi:hypothetical protein